MIRKLDAVSLRVSTRLAPVHSDRSKTRPSFQHAPCDARSEPIPKNELLGANDAVNRLLQPSDRSFGFRFRTLDDVWTHLEKFDSRTEREIDISHRLLQRARVTAVRWSFERCTCLVFPSFWGRGRAAHDVAIMSERRHRPRGTESRSSLHGARPRT